MTEGLGIGRGARKDTSSRFRGGMPYITIELMPSGWCCSHMKFYKNRGYAVYERGGGRFETRQEAKEEAQEWAKKLGVEVRIYG